MRTVYCFLHSFSRQRHRKRLLRSPVFHDYEKRLLDRNLRGLVAEGGQGAISAQLLPYALPYALRFGLLSDEQVPLVRFAHAWVRAFADLPGWAPPERARSEYVSDQPLVGEMPPGAGMLALGGLGW